MISEKKVLQIKTFWEIGQLTKTDITRKFKVSRDWIHRKAKNEGWEYAKYYTKVTDEIAKKSEETIIQKESDKVVSLAKRFLDDIDKQQKLINVILKDYATSIGEQSGRLSKADASRIFEAMKVNKITMETLLMGYQGARKALGVDKVDTKIEGNLNMNVNVKSVEEIAREVIKLTQK